MSGSRPVAAPAGSAPRVSRAFDHRDTPRPTRPAENPTRIRPTPQRRAGTDTSRTARSPPTTGEVSYEVGASPASGIANTHHAAPDPPARTPETVQGRAH